MPNNKTPDAQEQKAVPIVRRFWIPMFAAVLFLFAFGFGLKAVDSHFSGMTLPNTFIGRYNLGGMTETQVKDFVATRASEFERNGLRFELEGDSGWLYPTVSGVSDLDLTYTLYAVDSEKTARRVFALGKRGVLVERLAQALMQFFKPAHLSASYQLDSGRIRDTLKGVFGSHEQPTKQPRVQLQYVEGAETPSFSFLDLDTPPGVLVDYDAAIQLIEQRLASLSRDSIPLALVPDVPSIRGNELFHPENRINERLTRIFQVSEIEFERPTTTHHEYVMEPVKLPREELAFYLSFRKTPEVCADCPSVAAILNQDIGSFFSRVEHQANIKPLDAKFAIENGKVKEFQGARDGRVVNRNQLMSELEYALNDAGEFPSRFLLPMDTIKPNIATSQVNDLGIKEIIGVGKSNFKGSPKNRRHNIAVGAASVNGSLIPPGEEFSLLKTLGDVSAVTGYLPELVIKGDRTIPEYGGGLCQIGTTTFRGALDSGLPIMARTNHSYRVTYYEPAGTDATIYNPAPDLKFLNDTGHSILIQTRIEGDEAVFEFWGTKDGRSVEQTKPRIYNIVAPAPKKYIETLDLKPGEEKCTERAHSGADAEFTYTVTYSDGAVKENVFKSHYRPWQAVCLKGVVALSTTTPDALP